MPVPVVVPPPELVEPPVPPPVPPPPPPQPIGGVPDSIDDIYVPMLSSVLMAFYTYMRIRGIEEED